MEIRAVETFILRHPLNDQTFLSSQAVFSQRNSLLVRVETDSGLVGWGEGGQYGPPEPVAATVQHVLKPRLVGQDPLAIDVLWEQMYAFTRDFGRSSTPIEAISAVDIALWDIAGQALGQPIWKLLGGRHRDRLRLYATGFYYTLGDLEANGLPAAIDRARREAEAYIGAGFQAMKMKTGLLRPQEDLARVEAIRSVIGRETQLMVDANHAYSTHTALQFGRALEEQQVHWFEEPVVPEDMEGYKQLTRALSVAIAGGECLYTRYGFRDWLAERALDIMQPDLCVAGGISEVRKIATLGTTYQVPCFPHVWGSGIAVAAAAHLLAAIPPCPPTYSPIPGINDPMLEYDRTPNPLRDELVSGLQVADGWLAVPDAAGLGVDVNEDVVCRYSV